MKARGYGLPGRTSFTLFKFQTRDAIVMGIMGVLAVITLFCFLKGSFEMYYYPYVADIKTDHLAVVGYVSVLIFMCIPGILELKEKVLWSYLKSKI